MIFDINEILVESNAKSYHTAHFISSAKTKENQINEISNVLQHFCAILTLKFRPDAQAINDVNSYNKKLKYKNVMLKINVING